MRRREFITLLNGSAAAMAARRARAANGAAGDRVSPRRAACRLRAHRRRVPPGSEGNRLCRSPEHRNRIPPRWKIKLADLPELIAELTRRKVAVIVGNTPAAHAAKDRRHDGAVRLRERKRPCPGWHRLQPQPAGRQRHRRGFLQRRAGSKAGRAAAPACARSDDHRHAREPEPCQHRRRPARRAGGGAVDRQATRGFRSEHRARHRYGICSFRRAAGRRAARRFRRVPELASAKSSSRWRRVMPSPPSTPSARPSWPAA